MKKLKNLILLAVALIVVSSCQKNEIEIIQEDQKVENRSDRKCLDCNIPIVLNPDGQNVACNSGSVQFAEGAYRLHASYVRNISTGLLSINTAVADRNPDYFGLAFTLAPNAPQVIINQANNKIIVKFTGNIEFRLPQGSGNNYETQTVPFQKTVEIMACAGNAEWF